MVTDRLQKSTGGNGMPGMASCPQLQSLCRAHFPCKAGLLLKLAMKFLRSWECLLDFQRERADYNAVRSKWSVLVIVWIARESNSVTDTDCPKMSSEKDMFDPILFPVLNRQSTSQYQCTLHHYPATNHQPIT